MAAIVAALAAPQLLRPQFGQSRSSRGNSRSFSEDARLTLGIREDNHWDEIDTYRPNALNEPRFLKRSYLCQSAVLERIAVLAFSVNQRKKPLHCACVRRGTRPFQRMAGPFWFCCSVTGSITPPLEG